MTTHPKSTVQEIRERFDGDVDRFSNLDTGQSATVDAALCLDLVARAAAAATPGARTVLDVGCGAGNYSLKLREYLPAVRATLVDLSRLMLDRATQRLGAAAAEAYQGDIRELDFPAGSFDIVLAAAVLHHLRTPTEWENTFARFFRWLKPGGGLWVFDLVAHEDPAVQKLMGARYSGYLESLGGPAYRDKVLAYVEKEDTPTPLTYQLALLREAGFARVDVLHKNSCFAAYGGVSAR